MRVGGQRGPGVRPDDPVHGQTRALLEALDRGLRVRAEDAVDAGVVQVLDHHQEALQPAHVVAGGALLQGGATVHRNLAVMSELSAVQGSRGARRAV